MYVFVMPLDNKHIKDEVEQVLKDIVPTATIYKSHFNLKTYTIKSLERI